MQLRAWSGKSTVILTDYYGKDIFNMCEDFPELHKEYIAKNTDAQNRNTGDRIINGEISSSRDLALFVSVYEKFTVDLKDSQGDVKSEPKSASLLKPLGSVGVPNTPDSYSRIQTRSRPVNIGEVDRPLIYERTRNGDMKF